jgi:large subunit ribosomal protein L13
MEYNIDATDLVYGRLASFAAKQAMLGNKVTIFNAEQAIMTGKKETIYKKYFDRRARGQPLHGPFIPRMPDRFLRRAIRGMLPYKMPRGKEAFQRVMCYIGVPEKFKDVQLTKLPQFNIEKTNAYKFITVKQVCHWLGGKI